MKYFLAALITLHGILHLIGFIKGFRLASLDALSKEISKPMGLLWLIAFFCLVTTALLYAITARYWWVVAVAAVVCSQTLIVIFWHDTKYGTILNAILLFMALVGWSSWNYERSFQKDVAATLEQTQYPDTLLTTAMLDELPAPVRKYIAHSGALGKPLVRSWSIDFEGQIRKDEQSDWMPFQTRQYNFINPPARLFFMKATMFGLPVAGYHRFAQGKAVMDIRLLSLLRVQYQEGPEMNQAETVTWFNDLCLFAPGALIDQRIQWEDIDETHAKAIFTTGAITISATLFFNEKGELINFRSDDRYYTDGNGTLQKVPFSTPARDYIDRAEHRLPSYGEAVWNFSDHDLVYGQFTLRDIQYNPR